MNTLLLQPTDVLFFRDGRPMGGSLGGHGSAWPLPTVASAALHAALHRADLEKALGASPHGHDHHRRDGERTTNVRKFGSLFSAGPFPVLPDGTWLFPRPLDAGLDAAENDSTQPTLLPLATGFSREHSSLPPPLKYAITNTCGPTKKTPSQWWNAAAWETYLSTAKEGATPVFHKDEHFADTEFSYGIGMNPDTGTQDGERFYSAHYLRLKPDCRLGLFARAKDKDFRDTHGNNDLIVAMFPNSGSRTPMIVGGQQRLCTVQRDRTALLPLPSGRISEFQQQDPEGKNTWLVKWVLLSPAIFPNINEHLGGWLPSWVDLNGNVQLLDGPGKNYAHRHKVPQGQRISAKLVAALVGKPIPVTGYALPNQDVAEIQGGAKPTHLAVPVGSVYYFQCDAKGDADKLAAALNWHGADATFTTIRNRRSTVFGEKGFGLGVCGTWLFHDGKIPT